MSSRRSLWIVCVLAALHGIFFIWYQSPDWITEWSDQNGYRRLGEVLATTGQFTRFPDADTLVPEVIRTPAYPLFVAAIYKVFGVHQIAVALAQTALLPIICVAVYALGRRVASEGAAIAAAAAVALFPPLPYFAALVMTEVWTTLLFTAAMWLALRAVPSGRAALFAWLGVLIALTTLSRPAFMLFPFALAAIGIVVFPLVRVTPRPPLSRWLVMLAAFSLTMLPWFAYNYVTLGRFTLSPAGGVGRGLWEGSWQAMWSGRLQNELTHLADDIDDRAELDRRVKAVAARENLSPDPMLDYVHQWEDIRRIWVEPTDPYQRMQARVDADREYQRVALENLERDPLPDLVKRLSRGVFILWAGHIPFRYSVINHLPRGVIGAVWTVQAVIFWLAVGGLVVLAVGGRLAEACLLAAPIVYITAVHLPLLKEARQSLPAEPLVLLLAVIAVARLAGHSLPLKPQVHEAEHL